MFKINDDLSIYVTRGDAITLGVNAVVGEEPYTFKAGDVVRMKVFEKKACHCVEVQKDVKIMEETDMVSIELSKDDTKIGEVISKPKDYWYEVELNPETKPQTIIGYDEDGSKVFRLYPEGGDLV